jgi:hypothetical protein
VGKKPLEFVLALWALLGTWVRANDQRLGPTWLGLTHEHILALAIAERRGRVTAKEASPAVLATLTNLRTPTPSTPQLLQRPAEPPGEAWSASVHGFELTPFGMAVLQHGSAASLDEALARAAKNDAAHREKSHE